MIGTRQWISKVQKTILDKGDNISNKKNQKLHSFKKILMQGKKMSQVISYIWLNQDEKTAQELDEYFKGHHKKDLKKLFFAKDPETDEYKLLLKVFKEKTYLPIFDEDDEPLFNFRVITDEFEGNISDPEPSDDSILTITIPYPPRPEIFDDLDDSNTVRTIKGFTNIKQSELKEWLNQPPDEQPFFYENNPYIPTTTS